MVKYVDKNVWVEQVLMPDESTPIQGGMPDWDENNMLAGWSNVPAGQLADRTRFLKDKVEGLEQEIETGGSNALQKDNNLSDLQDVGQAKFNLGLNLVDNTRDLDKPVSDLTQEALDEKVDKVTGMGLSQESFTTSEKNKLAGLESSKFKGEFISLAALQSAFPTTEVGSYAYVDQGVGQDVVKYIWDSTDTRWVLQQGESAVLTPADVKSLYEANANTNAFTDAEKTKLSGIQAGAQVNTVTSVAGKTGAVTLVKGDVGLGNVDNTADSAKPVSTAQQTALNLKADLASPALTGTPTAPTAVSTTNTTQLATTAFVQAVNASDTGSAATAVKLKTARTVNGTSFDGSANITTTNWGTARNVTIGATAKSVNGSANVGWTLAEIGAEQALAAGTTTQYYRGDKTWQTLNKAAVGLGSVDNTADSLKNVASAGKLTTARTISATGDADWSVSFDGSGNSTAALTLVNSGVTAGTYPKVTVDDKGRVTAGASLSATDIPNLSASKITTGTLAVARGGTGASTLTGLVKGNGTAAMTTAVAGTDYVIPSGSITGNAATATALETGRTIGMTGDVTWTSASFNGSGNVTGVATLANSGVTAGTYTKVTVDSKGRVTTGAAMVASDIPALNATKANVLNGTNNSYVSGGTYLNVISWNSMGSLSANTSINLDTSLNHSLTAAASLTLDATNVDPGKTGDIVINTPTAVTVSWAAKWKFLGSVPNIGGAGETWVVSYKVFDANTIYAAAVKVA